MTGDMSLVNLGELSKPATVFMKKISEAVGGVFKPYQIVRVAKAEAEATRIQAEAQIQITDLHRRAMHRFLEEEAKKQSNIEAITQKALPLLEDGSKPHEVSDDWITNFFDKSRIISDNEMQQLWSRVLAGEANTPGAFSKRTVNLLGDLDRGDAILFARLCGFCWQIASDLVPLVFDTRAPIHTDQNVYFKSLTHLDSLGLIRFDSVGGFRRTRIDKQASVFYFGERVTLTFQKPFDNELSTGHVMLTRAGQELARVCGASPVPGFLEYVKAKWVAASLIPTVEPAHGEAPTET